MAYVLKFIDPTRIAVYVMMGDGELDEGGIWEGRCQ
jgi:transketolase N-terminal domain/subunit